MIAHAACWPSALALVATAGCGFPRPPDVGGDHVVAGRLHGLWDDAGGVTLRLVAGDVDASLPLTGNGPFQFRDTFAPGTPYTVSVASSPELHTCVVDGGSGMIAQAAPELSVACTGPVDGVDLSGAWGWAFDPSEDAQVFDGSLAAQAVAVTVRGSRLTGARVGDAAAAPGQPSAPIALPLGATVVAVALTAGGLSKTYQLTFRRGGAMLDQIVYGKASNTGANDSFGGAIALSGDTLAVAATGEASMATGVDGDHTDDRAPNAGAVYVFVRDGAVWRQQAYLKASNTDAGDRFGWSIGLSGDTLAVGAIGEASSEPGINGNQGDNSAPSSGAVYVFVRQGAAWNQQAYIKASNAERADQFGWSIALANDTLVVGAPGEASSATGVDPVGGPANNTAAEAGAVYVFGRTGATWRQQNYLKASNTEASDGFGAAVALSGDTLAVGATGEASRVGGVNAVNGQSNNAAPRAGAVYVFTRAGASWSQQVYLKASSPGTNDTFGFALALSGDTLAAGAIGEASAAVGVDGNEGDNSLPNAGAVYVFTRAGATWRQQAYLKASNTGVDDHFGWSLALSGDALLVGADGEDSPARGIDGDQTDDAAMEAGAAYLFVRGGATWQQKAYIKASNTGIFDRFGRSVALSPDALIVGATNEASRATGVNPVNGPSDNSLSTAGALYLFR
ncbi:MAG: integrin [Deltaproteobacteria bacterium]|nr:MAG: integrin [Deltaproteobacteria bacterium]TMQ27574.1 MAG: integrin [Deltaproteobacteria bacterium]